MGARAEFGQAMTWYNSSAERRSKTPPAKWSCRVACGPNSYPAYPAFPAVSLCAPINILKEQIMNKKKCIGIIKQPVLAGCFIGAREKRDKRDKRDWKNGATT
jgi:hypothetical protein